MPRSLPPLNALKAFEAAARHVSFTMAAAELNVTHAAVSRHIRDLEAWLGIKLFVRTGRGVELTERGKGYAEDVTRGFDILAHATDSASGRRRRRTQKLVVSVEPSFAALWLIPRLGRFTSVNPEIELVLESTTRLADFARGEADAGIRYGRGDWSGIAAERLAQTHMTPVCNPALLEASSIRAPSDLPAALLLQEESRRYWMEWLTAAGVSHDVRPEGPTLGLHLTVPAAEAGQGFALADEIIAGDALVSGRLVRPFAVSIESYGYYVVRAADRKETRPMAALRLWLQAEIAATVAAVAGGTAPKPAARKRRSAS